MRIAVANNFFYPRGGSERVMLDEIAGLRELGLEVEAFAQARPDNLPAPYAHLFLPEVDSASLKGLAKLRAAAAILYSGAQRRAFARFLDALQPQLVHGHNIYAWLTFSIVDEAAARGLPCVLTLHDFKLVCPSYLMLAHGEICERCLGGRFWHCTAQRCHKGSLAASLVNTAESYFNSLRGVYDKIGALICPSRFLLEKHAAAGFPRERLVHLPNALPLERYTPAYGKGEYVLYAGRLSREKGVLTLIRAAARARVPLRIAGTGPVEAQARALAADLDSDQVHFEGHCTGTRLATLYREAAAVAVCSEWYENAPMSVIEAYAYGKPVIGTRLGGIPELIRDGETGLLVPHGEPEDLAAALSDCLYRRDLAAMGRAARRFAETELDGNRHRDRLMAVYGHVLGRSVQVPAILPV